MTTVTVYFATNRQPHNDTNGTRIIGFGSELGPTGGLDVRYSSAQVEVDLRKQTQASGFPRRRRSDSHLSRWVFAHSRQHNDFRGYAQQHGAFGATDHQIHPSATVSSRRSSTRVWILAFYRIEAAIFVFTWPSSSSAIGVPLPYADYVHDRGTAPAYGPAVARTTRRLYDFVDGLQRDQHCMESIHLLCHSMGNYVLCNAVQALMRLPDGTAVNAGEARSMSALSSDTPDPSMLRRTFDRIGHAAADEDADAFDDPTKLKIFAPARPICDGLPLAQGLALNTLSAVTKFNGPRLGNDGPENMGTISDKVSAIDVSAVLSLAQDPENHQYYRVYPTVRDDIVAHAQRVAQKQIANREQISDWRINPKPARKPRRASAADRYRRVVTDAIITGIARSSIGDDGAKIVVFRATVSVVAPPSARWMACNARALLSSMIPEFRQRSPSNLERPHQTAQRAHGEMRGRTRRNPQ
jgi:esterase/lipase superfamily enzyme